MTVFAERSPFPGQAKVKPCSSLALHTYAHPERGLGPSASHLAFHYMELSFVLILPSTWWRHWEGGWGGEFSHHFHKSSTKSQARQILGPLNLFHRWPSILGIPSNIKTSVQALAPLSSVFGCRLASGRSQSLE